ncbi:tRNA (adenosine(37)-N6)-threonylcarbamoyltransferase complex ATPase subunit type 1 TsaE [Candidatus Saccharibacteria bacterium]|nr:tRNA (adenosine(37)-N6)-threonylcarbamoyltransferase complex ATPase subunit type 1 TsaE [Candidatus Saccharibacteria bacterium]
MIDFGERFADYLNGRTTDLGGLPQNTRGRRLWEGKIRQDPPANIVIELIGDVGAGKTTFVRGFAKGLGVEEPVTSPSFTISKQYALPDGKCLVHYDFYRLPDPGLMSEDLQESINNPNTITVIEWADSVSGFLPSNHAVIKISYNDDGSRTIML